MLKPKNPLLIVPGIFLLIAGALLLHAINPVDDKASTRGDATWPTREELVRKLRDIRKLIVVYGTGSVEHADAYRDYAEGLTQRSRWLTVVVKPDTLVTEEELTSLPLSIVGTPESNTVLRRIQDGLPFKLRDGHMELPGLLALQDNDVYDLTVYPNPLNRSMPVSVTTGHRDETIIALLQQEHRRRYFRSGEFWVYRSGQGILLGFFTQKDGEAWEIDDLRTRNYLTDWKPVTETTHYSVVRHGTSLPTADLHEFMNEHDARASQLLQTLTGAAMASSQTPKIEYHLYASLEDKGLMTHNTDLSHADFDHRRVHAVYNNDLQGTDFYSDARLLTTTMLGENRSLALQEGLAVYFSVGWGRHGFRHWAALFAETETLSGLDELLDNEAYKEESYLFMRPQAGSFVDYLVTTFGWTRFISWYRDWPERGLPVELAGRGVAEIEAGWRDHLATYSQAQVVDRDDITFGFHKGFCYAHEGYQIYNGYLSRKSFESLEKLRSLGTDWISLTPFGYLRDATKPEHFRYSFGAGSESDESLIVASLYAKQLGMGVMLKPHVLMSGPSWGWPGDVKMQNQQDWDEFFRCYFKWIRHYAVLAQMYDLDMLCLGVELLNTTVPEHQDAWRDIIRRVRKLYHGPLVYAANWWQEFEQIAFWDELDYIGLNCYYPLSNKETVTAEDLKRGVQAFLPTIEKVATAYNKPVLLTEVGFTSSAQNWKSPHERKRGSRPNVEDQVMCYEAMFESLWDKDWLHGLYWWKWPSYLENGGPDHNGFTPNGKPAEAVVKRWYADRDTPARTYRIK